VKSVRKIQVTTCKNVVSCVIDFKATENLRYYIVYSGAIYVDINYTTVNIRVRISDNVSVWHNSSYRLALA